ncbi:response regulator transcription factor [Burkholderia sp. Ac-20353]|nr:response regulator transcription factor [Burkholderia sp. Ac-20353]
MRRGGDDLPVVMIGARDDVVERVKALDCGADDFILKPLNVREVLARIRRVMKRAMAGPLQAPSLGRSFSFNGFCLDYAAVSLVFHGAPIQMAQAEYATLGVFAKFPGIVLSRDVIAQRIQWSEKSLRSTAKRAIRAP